MRPALYHRDSRYPAVLAGASPAPIGITAQISSWYANSPPYFAVRIAEAAFNVLRRPALSVMPSRTRMSSCG